SAGWLHNGRVDAFVVRLPAALSASLCVLLLYVVLRQRGRPVAGFLAALILSTAQHFTWLARTARIDMPLTLCVAIAVLAVYLGGRWKILGFAAMAAGALLKGPVAIVLPLAVILFDALASHWACHRGLNPARTSLVARLRSLVWGVPLAIALALP